MAYRDNDSQIHGLRQMAGGGPKSRGLRIWMDALGKQTTAPKPLEKKPAVGKSVGTSRQIFPRESSGSRSDWQKESSGLARPDLKNAPQPSTGVDRISKMGPITPTNNLGSSGVDGMPQARKGTLRSPLMESNLPPAVPDSPEVSDEDEFGLLKSPVFQARPALKRPLSPKSPMAETSPLLAIPRTPIVADDSDDDAPATTGIKRTRELEPKPLSLFFKKSRDLHAVRQRLHGFTNLGNTCYLSAIVQVLVTLESFCKSFKSIRLPLPSLPEDGVARCLSDIMRQKQEEGSDMVVNPSALKAAVAKLAPCFNGTQQQDAHEFLCTLLHSLQQEVFTQESKLHEKEKATVNLTQTSCPATQNFSCMVERKLECSSCGDETEAVELFQHFSVDLPSDRPGEDGQVDVSTVPSLQKLLEQYFQEEILEKHCEKCKGTSCVLRRKIRRLPRVMVVHIKRFCFDTSGDIPCMIKRSDKVLLDESLDLGFCSADARPPLAMDDTNQQLLSSRKEPLKLKDVTNLLWQTAGNGKVPERVPSAEAAGSSYDRLFATQPGMGSENCPPTGTGQATGATAAEAEKVECLQSAPRPEVPLYFDVVDRAERGELQPSSSACAPEAAHSYTLHSVVSHLGQTSSWGHYVADVYDEHTQHWYHCDDTLVRQVSRSDILSTSKQSEAYICVYVHQSLLPPPPASQSPPPTNNSEARQATTPVPSDLGAQRGGLGETPRSISLQATPSPTAESQRPPPRSTPAATTTCPPELGDKPPASVLAASVSLPASEPPIHDPVGLATTSQYFPIPSTNNGMKVYHRRRFGNTFQ